MNTHYMLPHLAKNRESDKFRGFSYRKILVESPNTTDTYHSKIINWEIKYQDTVLNRVSTLREAKIYIASKAAR